MVLVLENQKIWLPGLWRWVSRLSDRIEESVLLGSVWIVNWFSEQTPSHNEYWVLTVIWTWWCLSPILWYSTATFDRYGRFYVPIHFISNPSFRAVEMSLYFLGERSIFLVWFRKNWAESFETFFKKDDFQSLPSEKAVSTFNFDP